MHELAMDIHRLARVLSCVYGVHMEVQQISYLLTSTLHHTFNNHQSLS